MKTTGLTLAEALATGRPFKHKHFVEWIKPNTANNGICTLGWVDFYDPVWQVQEEEKPPMRVWLDKNGTISLRDCTVLQWNEVDITESLASALAPYIKKELNL